MTTTMRISATVLALTALSVTPASAECRIGDPTLDKHIVSERQLQAGGDSDLVRNLRKLRRAAYVLQKYDRDGACQSVVAAIQDILESPAKTSGDETAKAQQGDDARPDQSILRTPAKSITAIGGRVCADRLIGSDLIGNGKEPLGEIEDLVLDSGGAPAYVLISHGGFLGLGEKIIAVPFDLLQVSEDRDVFFLPMTADQIEAAPAFDRGRFDWLGDERWRDQLERYFEEQTTRKKSQ